MARSESCKNCYFFERETLTCHANPPALFQFPSGRATSEFPPVGVADWCGKFQQKEEQ